MRRWRQMTLRCFLAAHSLLWKLLPACVPAVSIMLMKGLRLFACCSGGSIWCLSQQEEMFLDQKEPEWRHECPLPSDQANELDLNDVICGLWSCVTRFHEKWNRITLIIANTLLMHQGCAKVWTEEFQFALNESHECEFELDLEVEVEWQNSSSEVQHRKCLLENEVFFRPQPQT